MKDFRRAWWLRLYRAGVVVAVAVMVHQQAAWLDAQRSPAVSLRQARKYFRSAIRLELRDVERGLYFATDSRGETVGSLLTTSPFSDQVIGYSGPNNLLLALDGHGGGSLGGDSHIGAGVVAGQPSPFHMRLLVGLARRQSQAA